MGGMLTQPETNKQSDEGEGLGLRFGLSSMQGWRSEMEDAHDVKIGLKYGLNDWSYFAVFDGHAGKRAAAFAAWNLLDFILRDSQFKLETDNTNDQMYIEPDIEKSPSANSCSNQPSNKTNGGETTSEISIHDTESDQKKDDTVNKEAQEIFDKPAEPSNESSVQNETVPKPKFVSYPVLEQLEMVQNAIKSGFLRIDESMRSSREDVSGSTAVCTFISPTHLFIANCGDSRAVLYDGVEPKFATEDHKPSNPRERQRIIEAGGSATQRINGTLAVSRALGDFDFKKNAQKGPCEQLVSPEPEVTVIARQPGDQFLILACDGIWDVMLNHDLCKFIEYQLKVEPNLKKVCSSVLDVCLHKGSRDNMSIIIVVFENGPKFSEEEQKKDRENDIALKKIAEELNYYESFSKSLFFNTFCDKLEEKTGEAYLPPGAGLEAKYDLLQDVFNSREANAERERTPPLED